MAWSQVGNRWYQLTSGVVEKSVYHEDDDVYVGCGSWPEADFLAHANPYDENTEANYAAIKTALGI